MNYNRYSLILILGIIILQFSCGNKAGPTSRSQQGKPTIASPSISTDTVERETSIADDPYADILEKDIFTPPDMRSSMKAPILTEEKIIEPQKLTITGIVFDGAQYLVSVENMETGESNYLKVNDQLIDYSIITIDFDKVITQKKKEVKIYQVGDQIPIPGTGTQRVKESTIAEDTTELDNINIKNETESPLPLAGDSLEERLRKRRQQQEEELK